MLTAGTILGKMICYHVDLPSFNDFAEFNEIACEYLSIPFLVRTKIEVELRGFDVLINAVGAIPKLS